MPSPPEYPDDDEAGGSYLALEAIDHDLGRLGELTGLYVTDPSDDLAVAAARIPHADLRREAEELLERLRPLADSHLADSVIPDGGGGLQPALRPPCAAPQHRRASRQPHPAP
jgi:nucleotide-binding universal stress UspA family protein